MSEPYIYSGGHIVLKWKTLLPVGTFFHLWWVGREMGDWSSQIRSYIMIVISPTFTQGNGLETRISHGGLQGSLFSGLTKFHDFFRLLKENPSIILKLF